MWKTDRLISFFKAILLCSFFLISSVSSAQMIYGNQMLGTGAIGGGLNSCPYQQDVGDEAESIADDIEDINNKMDDLKDKLKEAKSTARTATGKAERTLNSLERRGIKKEYLDVIADHVNEQRSCVDYTTSGSSLKVEPFTPEQWGTICQVKGGKTINAYACSMTAIIVDGASFDQKTCSSNLKEYQESVLKKKKADADVDSLQAAIDNLKDQKASLKDDYKHAVRDHQKELKEESTEAGCIPCMIAGGGYTFRKGKTDWGGVALNSVLGVASMALDNNLQKYVANQNARLGYSTQSYPSYGYAPYMMNALGSLMGGSFYGAIGGGAGAGAFGCASMGGSMYGGGNGNGSAFGYPQNYFGTPIGGGIFANGGAGYTPYGNMMGNGNPMFGMMANGGGGYNPYGNLMGGNPMFGGGLNIGGGFNPYGNGMGGNPMFGGGLNAMGGFNPYGNMMGNGMYNPYAGMNGLGNGMMDPSMQMQMQQMQMQMQMQMQQQQMQMYQRAQQNYQSRQQVVMSLQQEMQSLAYRIQQAQMGVNTGGYLDFSSGGSSYYGNQNGTLFNNNLNNNVNQSIQNSSVTPTTR